MNAPTPGPWIVWKLAPDSDPQERVIITTADGEEEICGIVHRAEDARLIAAAPELLASLRAMQAAYGKLHDMLSDAIEGGRLKQDDIPDDYRAIVEQLAGACNAADHAAEIALEAAGAIAVPDVNAFGETPGALSAEGR
jgi:hypothetical protein